MTNTPVNTATNTPADTATNTPTTVPTATRTPGTKPTPAEFVISDPAIFPNPYNSASGSGAYFRCDLTQDAKNLKIKIYTMGFRAIREVTLAGILEDGRVDRSIPAADLARLANGIYYYMVTGENGQGARAKSPPELLIILK
jgi:hypothetical protein